jgi:hypothetical protein
MLFDGSIKEHNVDGHVYIYIETGLPPAKRFI